MTVSSQFGNGSNNQSLVVGVPSQQQFPVGVVTLSTTFRITAAQIKAWDGTSATSIIVIPAPAAGSVVRVLNGSFNTHFVTTAITGGAAVSLSYISGATLSEASGTMAAASITSCISSATNQTTLFGPFTSGASHLNTSLISGAPVAFNTAGGSAYATGDTTVTGVIQYVIISVL